MLALLVSSYEPARGCEPRDAVPVNTHNLTLAHHRVSSSSVVEHPTRSWRVVCSNPFWDLDIFQVYVSPRIYIISCWCYFSVDIIMYVCMYVILLKHIQCIFQDVYRSEV